MNKVILIGRLVADPELKVTQSGVEVTNFRIAVDRPYSKDAEKKADFIDIVAWRKTAAFVCRYFTKGKPIIVYGSLRTHTYETQDGSKRYVTEVLADNVEFVPNSKNDAHAPSQGYSQPSYTVLAAARENLIDDSPSTADAVSLDDDLPF